ncbi:MAG: hypothetical protein R3C69_13490 [Geminicoccaceae bacterium]
MNESSVAWLRLQTRTSVQGRMAAVVRSVPSAMCPAPTMASTRASSRARCLVETAVAAPVRITVW